MYHRGLLYIANDGLIQICQADLAHNVEYSPILVSEVYVRGKVQPLHLKQDHPCDTCTRLKLLPR